MNIVKQFCCCFSALSKYWKSIAWPLGITYLVLPILLWMFPSIHNFMIFFHYAKWPYMDYSNFRAAGVATQGRNFKLEANGVQLGVWHILPKSLHSAARLDEISFNSFLGQPEGRPIFIYLHGNAATRAQDHRVGLYNFLAMQDFHVFALDYRGFADSSGWPTEAGVIADSIALYRWMKEKANGNPIFLWGHSLGSAIGAGAAAELCRNDECPDGLILEGPFNNLAEILRHHPFTLPYQWLPAWLFDSFVVDPCIEQDLILSTDTNLKDVECPIMILHAQDDEIVPFKLAKQLSSAAKDHGRDVTFIEFDHPRNYGHKFIHRAPELADILYEFVQKCLSEETSAGEIEKHI